MCAWAAAHGPQIVNRDGAVVSKVGPYDGHVTNDADVVYQPVR